MNADGILMRTMVFGISQNYYIVLFVDLSLQWFLHPTFSELA